jgi:DNA-binding beta-propeller fold protein YncE
MRKRIGVLLAVVGLIASSLGSVAASAQERHLLYMTSPDGAQPGGSGEGLLVFDMDKGHTFVRRIDVPSFKEGVRGINASAATGRLYVTTNGHRVVCFDLNADKVLWERTYDTGCDQGALTPDGKLFYVPSGFWSHDQCWMVLNAISGDEIAPRIKTGGNSHNSLASLDGSRVYLGSDLKLTVVDTKDHSTVMSISPIGESGVFPFTFNGAQTRIYACLGKTVGFDIADLTTGKVLTRVVTDGEPIKRRTHGVALTPDEKEIWISDQGGNAVFVFDNTVWPPKQAARIAIKKGGHGWVAFSLDGRYAYTSSVEVIDVKARKPVTVFKDERGKEFSTSKFVEIVFDATGKVTRVGDRFGMGRVTPTK